MNRRRTLIALISALVITGFATPVIFAANAQATAKPAVATSSPITYAVAGDSLSANSDSWLHQMNDPGLSFVGGFQQAGYTTNGALANIQPGTADVLVVMLGTNDIRYGFDADHITSTIEQIVTKFGGASHVLISFTPPSDYTDDNGIDRRTQGIIVNRALVAVAAKHNWLYADPFSFQRGWNNAWGTGASTDKTHPTAAVSLLVSQRMSIYIRQAVNGAGA